MNKTEMAKLLTIASAIDNRKLTTEAVEAWFMVIGDIDYDVAVEAVRQHFDASTDYLVPNHVRVLSSRITKVRREQECREAERLEREMERAELEKQRLENPIPRCEHDRVIYACPRCSKLALSEEEIQ